MSDTLLQQTQRENERVMREHERTKRYVLELEEMIAKHEGPNWKEYTDLGECLSPPLPPSLLLYASRGQAS